MDYSKLIKFIREKLFLSQTELANLLDVSYSTVSRWEAGYFKPTIKNFFTFNRIPVNQDFENKFALSELVQFVYRSAIRNGKPIDVYIPSKRMRDLFIEWLKKPNV